jgi:ABC-type uncharacterized transport system permease subunit
LVPRRGFCGGLCHDDSQISRREFIQSTLQSIGITQGFYFFNAAPYILTLVIMAASAGSKQALRDVPGELSITK